jgi:hypothetical protein
MAGFLWNYRYLAAFAMTWLALTLVAGCALDSEPAAAAPDPCPGGVVDDDGNCAAKCDPSKCLENNICAGNECVIRCSDHHDCPAETSACTDTVEDDTELPVRVCVDSGRRRRLPDHGVGTPCPDGLECLFFHCADDTPCNPTDPNACPMPGECQLRQTQTLYCPNGLQCDFDACGGDPGACVVDTARCPKAEDPDAEPPPCNIGKCEFKEPNELEGTECAAFTCGAEQCTFMSCIDGDVLVPGNANAYCTTDDCTTDAECAPGYYCGARRDPHEVCGAMKGNNTVCGETPDPCIDPAINDGFGGTYFEGSNCLMRFSCLKREQCTPCENNLDCSLGKADVCFNIDGSLSCQPFCNTDDDCLSDSWCAPYFGVAGATGTCAALPTKDCLSDDDCGDGDTCTPRTACVPRSGACQAADVPEPKFCHQCVDDEDCKSGSGNWVCLDPQWLYGGFSGMKACYDLDLLEQTGSCQSDADCPQSPGGAFGECLDGGEGLDSMSSLWQTCYFPFISGDSDFTCFP